MFRKLKSIVKTISGRDHCSIVLIRDTFTNLSTTGKLYINGVFFCYTLEDPVIDENQNGTFDGNEVKVYGKTAIPYGAHAVKLTMSSRFGVITPELINVKHFVGIRIHWGNYPQDTLGCILVGAQRGKDVITSSKVTFKKLMTKLLEFNTYSIVIKKA